MIFPFFKHILETKVFIPIPAQKWEVADLPFSKHLHLLFKASSYKNLEDLMGKKYGELFEFPNADSSHIKELFKVLHSLTSLDGFRTVEFQVSISKQKRMKELSKESPLNHLNTEKSEQNQNTKNNNISEDLRLFLNDLDNGNSIPSEFKDIFAVMEIDESSHFLQLKSEKIIEESGFDEIISIPTEYRDTPLFELDLSIRLDNVLRRLKIQTLGDLHGKNFAEIKAVKNCGKKSLDELCKTIERLSGSFQRKSKTNFDKIAVPEVLADVPIAMLNPSVRLTNVLVNLNISQLGDLRKFSLSEIRVAENCGNKTIDELTNFIGKFTDENWAEEIRQKRIAIPRNETKKIIVSPLIKDISVNCFNLSTRLKNVFCDLKVETLAHLENFAIRDFLRIKNFGRKTFDELCEFVERIEQANDFKDLFGEKTESLPSELDLNGLLNFINKFVAELSEREREIFMSRLGGSIDEKILTLEELGDKFTLTRERVRQIESKIFKELNNRLSGIAENALEKLKLSSEMAVCPITVRLLTYLTNNSYELFVYPPNFYLHLLKKLSPEIFVENQPSEQPNVKISKLYKHIKSLLDDEVYFITLSQLFERIVSFQIIEKFSINDFFEAIRNKSFIIENGDTPDVLLISTDKNKLTMTEMAWQVLKNSERALLPEEIIEEARRLYGADTELNSERSLANLPSYDQRFYLLDRRRIGLRQHFKLPEEKWREVTDDFYSLLLEKQRPVSTTEVFNKKLFEWTSQSTASETTEILREDGRFKDLGRFLFALADWEVKERESLKDLVIRILQETNEALTAAEIGERIQKHRSVAATSMQTILNSVSDIQKFEFAYYGLKSKGNYCEFFVGSEKYMKRLVKTFSPITFGDLCRKLEIEISEPLAEKGWQTLQNIPQIRCEPTYCVPETIIKFSY